MLCLFELFSRPQVWDIFELLVWGSFKNTHRMINIRKLPNELKIVLFDEYIDAWGTFDQK
jgi:hypothetical protein